MLGTTLLLGFWYELLGGLILIGMVARRAVLEERVLREELEEYSVYMTRVRYRFVPYLCGSRGHVASPAAAANAVQRRLCSYFRVHRAQKAVSLYYREADELCKGYFFSPSERIWSRSSGPAAPQPCFPWGMSGRNCS